MFHHSKSDTTSACPFHALFGNGSETKHTKLEEQARLAKKDSISDSKLNTLYPKDALAKVNALLDGIDIEPHLLVPNMFFNQITSPGVTQILERTGVMRNSSVHRYQKTSSFLFDIPRDPTTEQSQQIIKRVKAMHDAAGVVPNSKDFHYGLYCFTKKMVDMLREFDTTPPTPDQELAWYNIWKQICFQLGSTNLPKDYTQFCKENQAYEKELRKNVNPKNQEFAQVMFSNMIASIPVALRPITRHLLHGVMDPELANALNLDLGTSLEHRILRQGLRLSSSLVALSKSVFASIRDGGSFHAKQAIST